MTNSTLYAGAGPLGQPAHDGPAQVDGVADPAPAQLVTTDLALNPALAKIAARTQAADAKANRGLHVKATEARLAAEAREAKREAKDAKAKAKQEARAKATEARLAQRAARRQAKAERRASLLAYLSRKANQAKANSASLYTFTVYGLAVGVAFGGQANVARKQFGWEWPAAIGAAGFLEGMALSMALTAQQMRLRGERALLPRILTWVFALIAACINWAAHYTPDHYIKAAVLAMSSLGGITVWEIRTGAKYRKALRAIGLLPQPRPTLGLVFAVRYPIQWWYAWSACVSDPEIRTRADALKAGRMALAFAKADRAVAKARAEARRAEAKRKAILIKAANKAASKAGANKNSGPVMVALVELALAYKPGPALLALETKASLMEAKAKAAAEAEARAKADAKAKADVLAAAELEAKATAQRIQAEAEAEAKANAERIRTEAEARARATCLQAEANAARLEADTRAKMEAEAKATMQHIEAGAQERAKANAQRIQAEAEARAGLLEAEAKAYLLQAEAEAGRLQSQAKARADQLEAEAEARAARVEAEAEAARRKAEAEAARLEGEAKARAERIPFEAKANRRAEGKAADPGLEERLTVLEGIVGDGAIPSRRKLQRHEKWPWMSNDTTDVTILALKKKRGLA